MTDVPRPRTGDHDCTPAGHTCQPKWWPHKLGDQCECDCGHRWVCDTADHCGGDCADTTTLGWRTVSG